ncbi:MAG TPA: hypothetical protein VK034_25595, partial [Enhygromyxa sp.]|nr:hypothetical protein [Enhygromyxa sp.]
MILLVRRRDDLVRERLPAAVAWLVEVLGVDVDDILAGKTGQAEQLGHDLMIDDGADERVDVGATDLATKPVELLDAERLQLATAEVVLADRDLERLFLADAGGLAALGVVGILGLRLAIAPMVLLALLKSILEFGDHGRPSEHGVGGVFVALAQTFEHLVRIDIRVQAQNLAHVHRGLGFDLVEQLRTCEVLAERGRRSTNRRIRDAPGETAPLQRV